MPCHVTTHTRVSETDVGSYNKLLRGTIPPVVNRIKYWWVNIYQVGFSVYRRSYLLCMVPRNISVLNLCQRGREDMVIFDIFMVVYGSIAFFSPHVRESALWQQPRQQGGVFLSDWAHDYRAFRTAQAALQTETAVVSSHELISCGKGGELSHCCCWVCVFFTSNRSFYPSASSTTNVRADSSILEEIQGMWSQSYATEILQYVAAYEVPGMQ